MPVEDYVRPFESVKGYVRDFPTEEPAFVRRLAAVTLRARLQRRDLRDETIEIAESITKRMSREMPPPPADWSDGARKILASVERRQRCTFCGVRPGFTPCALCHGIGCSGCNEGWLSCTTCDGTREVVVAVIRHVEDREVIIRHTYLPATTLMMEEALLGTFLDEEPDECLRFDVDLRTTAAPYREVEGDYAGGGMFHDHAFLGAIDRARTAVAAIAGHDWLREEVSAYARPFFWVGWSDDGTRLTKSVALVPGATTTHLLGA